MTIYLKGYMTEINTWLCMNEITVNQLKTKKTLLAIRLMDLITDFNETTGLDIDTIDIEYAHIMSGEKECIGVQINIIA